MKRRVAAKLPSTASGVELLDYLSGRFAYHSREDWCQKIHDGELALDGAVCRDPQRVLCSNSLLEYFPQNLEEPAVNCDYQIIYEDECLLVIDKPGNLPVHPAGPYFAHTLWALLHDAGYEKIHFVNRLDRETSGLMIAAKNSDAASTLASALPEMVKTYQVVVHGTFPEELTAVGFLAHDERSGIRKKQRFFLVMCVTA